MAELGLENVTSTQVSRAAAQFDGEQNQRQRLLRSSLSMSS